MTFTHLRMSAGSAVCGIAALAVMPFGCAGSAEQTQVHQPSAELAVPNITAERLRECVDTYQDQFTASDYRVRIRISIDERGREIDLTPTVIAKQAPDFTACVRVALHDMQVPDAVYHLRARGAGESSTGQTSDERNQLGTVTTAGAEIALEELIAAAGGTTVVFVVAIVVVAASGVADIAEALTERERCRKVLDMCIEKCTEEAIPSGSWSGDRFFKCRRRCLEAENCWGQSY